MKIFKYVFGFSIVACVGLIGIEPSIAQTTQKRVNNNPYSPSPTASGAVAATSQNKLREVPAQNGGGPSAGAGFDALSGHPSTVYRIGVSDVLKINLMNAAGGIRYVKVGVDGRIDFPLAPVSLLVVGKTAEDVAGELRSAIKLFADPRVSVEVREFASHIVSIGGLVDLQGAQQIQRDAVPFFVIRSGVTVDKRATNVRITRGKTNTVENYGLSDRELGKIFVFPGDKVDFLQRTGLDKE